MVIVSTPHDAEGTAPTPVQTPTQATDPAPVATPTQAAHAPTMPAHGGAPVVLGKGERLGDRYVVQGFLGEGGMGSVYRALDERIGEDVALKIVRGVALHGLPAEVRLAQKVTHPNVCRTYDLEEAGGYQFVKMEYVAGETLAARMRTAGALPFDEAVRIARAIADGLAAAHRQGIVHRDLKPGNVMLDNGRTVLMDFGIASMIAEPIDGVAGTLGYMAPEQIMKLDVDGRADHYALGCLLFEMVAGKPVFEATTPIELATRHVSQPAPDVRSRRAETPRWLARAIALMLAKDPAMRFQGVLRLRAGARRPWRVLVPGVALAGLAVGAFTLSAGSEREPCVGIAGRLAGVWDPAIKLKVRLGFLATKKPYAAAAFAQLERTLDGYASQWTAIAVDSCRATRVRRDQTEEVLSLRQACLDQRLAELGALATVLADPHPLIVEKADRIVTDLEPLDGCTNIAALRQPGLPAPEIAPQVNAIRAQLVIAKADVLAGRHLPALVDTQKAIAAAERTGYLPIKAEALYLRGTSLLATGNVLDAGPALKEAAWAAMQGKRDDIVATAALAMVVITGEALGRPSEASVWYELAAAAAKRGGFERQFEVRLAAVEGLVAVRSGDYAAAVAAHEKAFAAAERAYGRENPTLWADEATLASTLTKAFAYARAVPHYEHAIALRESVVGAEHPDIAVQLSNLGSAYFRLGEHERARAAFKRALAIREKAYGKQSPLLVPTLVNYADLLTAEGDATAALALVERAKHMAAQLPGVEHFAYHETATTHAEVVGALGRIAEARKLFDELLALELRLGSTVLATTENARAELELAAKAWADAARFAESSIARFEASGGKHNPELWRPLTALARAKLGLGDKAAAKPLLERALAISDKAGNGDYKLQLARDLLASL